VNAEGVEGVPVAGRVPNEGVRSGGGLPAGWGVFLVFALSLGASILNDKLCLAVLGGSTCYLVLRHRDSPASVLGIIFATSCESPFLRRIHDLYHGYTPGSSILIASYCAYPVLGVLLLRELPKLRKPQFIPLVLAAIGVLWAYGVGVLSGGIYPASIQLLQYCAGPLVFAYVLVRSERLDVKAFCRWLLVLAAIEAVYGIAQWIYPPPWDVVWFNGVGMQSAGGRPLPFMMRTFGTLNIVSPYSYFLAFILTVTLETQGFLFVSPLMFGALATTMARSAWGTLVVGWGIALVLARAKDKARMLVAIGGTLGLVAVLALPFAGQMSSLTRRLDSVGNLKGDNSFRNRSELMAAAIEGGALEDPVGVGLGSSGAAARATENGVSGIDNGFLQTVWLFGWTGGLFYLGGFFAGLARGLLRGRLQSRTGVLFAGAIVALFSANLFESSFDDLKGVMLWVGLGIINIPFASKDSDPDEGKIPARERPDPDLPAVVG
jgi:hypothetical protein